MTRPLMLTLLLVACSGDTTTDEDTDKGTTDVEGDTDADADADADADTDSDTDTDVDTGETATVETGETAAVETGDTALGPLVISQATVTCFASGARVRYFAEANGWTSDGLVNTMETGNSFPWNDEHDLLSYTYDPYGSWDYLEQVLDTVASITTWVPNQSTLFSCTNHFEVVPEIMTYMVRIYDLDGNLADCIAWGHDAPGFLNGAYDGVMINPPTDHQDRQSCTAI